MMKEFTIKAEPFSWNTDMAEIALEDLAFAFEKVIEIIKEGMMRCE